MAEDTEEQKAEPLDVQRYLSIVRRRYLYFLIPLLFGWLAVWGVSWLVPPRYKSSTLILVQQPTMPRDYIAPNVNENLQDRLQSISQQILSRTRLLLIIEKLHLYGANGSDAAADEKVEQMRKDINIELVRDNRGDQITAFRVNYSARDAQTAQNVTSDLTNIFIHENQKVVEQESQSTTDFIGSQLENARASLSVQEAKVRQFQGQHEGSLPTQQASNLQILAGLQAQLQNEQDALNTAKQQRVYLQSQIEQYRGIHGTSRRVDGTPTSLSTIDLELETLRTKLADLSSHYTERYPDVVSTKDQIAKTQKMRDELVAELKRNSNAAKQANESATAQEPPDAAQTAPVLQLQGQLQANQAELQNREESVAGLKARISEYQGRLNQAPAVEQQMADLTRGYEQSKADFDELLKKKNASTMATSMEQMQQGERFTMLDPPSLPLKPDFPNRLKFCAAGILFGLVLGIVAAGGSEFFDGRLYSEKEIKVMLPVVILSEVPEIVLPSDERRGKRNAILGWATAVFVAVTMMAGTAFSFFHN